MKITNFKSTFKKRFLPISMLKVVMILSFTASSVHATEQRIDYSCFVKLEDQTLVVHQFVAEGESRKAFIKKLLGKMVYFSDGVSGSKIEDIRECVVTGQSFKSREARKIAEKTLM